MRHAFFVASFVWCVEGDVPVAAMGVLRKWYFPVRATSKTCPLPFQRSHHDGGREWVRQVVGRLARHDAALLFQRSHHDGGRERCARVRAQEHTLHASSASPFRGKERRCDSAATGKKLGRRRFPRCYRDSVVQVLLVAPVVSLGVRLTGGCS
jgi:hypothetical protein